MRMTWDLAKSLSDSLYNLCLLAKSYKKKKMIQHLFLLLSKVLNILCSFHSASNDNSSWRLRELFLWSLVAAYLHFSSNSCLHQFPCEALALSFQSRGQYKTIWAFISKIKIYRHLLHIGGKLLLSFCLNWCLMVLFFYNQLTSKAVEKDFSRNRALHFPCGSLTTEESAVIISTPLQDIPLTLKKPSNDYGEGQKSMRAFSTGSILGKNAKDKKAIVPTSDKQTLGRIDNGLLLKIFRVNYSVLP